MNREPEVVDWGRIQEPAPRGPGRPRRKHLPKLDTDGDPVSKSQDAPEPDAITHNDALNVRSASLIGGVNITWLTAAFRIDARTARKRLAGLKPIGVGKRDAEVYDFVEAASYLAPPQQEKFARWMTTLRTSDMPTHLQDTYWAAMRKRQIWEQNAAELWKTDDVIEVLGEVFKTLKSNMQLWVDNIDSNNDMPQDQRAKLTQMVDGLQAELYTSLCSMASKRETRSSLFDPEVITNQEGVGPKFVELPEDDEDLIG